MKTVFYRWMSVLICSFISLCLSACQYAKPASHLVPQQSAKPSRLQAYHTVRSGETLYQIAWRYGLDYRKLAHLNALQAPYPVYPGQRLRVSKMKLRSQAGSPVANACLRNRTTCPKAKPYQAEKSVVKSTAPQGFAAEKGKPLAKGIRLQWPATGPLIREYSLAKGSNGVDIKGRKGDSIRAAASGIVVYSGSGLRGYGRLIIIKHNDEYLTAYAHNSKLLVKEGQKVKAGEKIAEMGRSGSNQIMLHFELRRNGQPVNPLHYVPKPRFR